VTFDQFLASVFDGNEAPQVELAHAERLFRDPSAAQRFPREKRVEGFRFLAGAVAPQLWHHGLPSGARISCVSSMVVLYRDLFAADPLGETAHMWFDWLEQPAPSCAGCAPVHRAVLGVLQDLLAMPSEECQRAALHGLNHWGTAAERRALIDSWLPGVASQDLRAFALECRAGKYM
jgi:hypothetical protein